MFSIFAESDNLPQPYLTGVNGALTRNEKLSYAVIFDVESKTGARLKLASKPANATKS